MACFVKDAMGVLHVFIEVDRPPIFHNVGRSDGWMDVWSDGWSDGLSVPLIIPELLKLLT